MNFSRTTPLGWIYSVYTFIRSLIADLRVFNLHIITKTKPKKILGFVKLIKHRTNYFGMTTVSITWITPLLPITSVATISL